MTNTVTTGQARSQLVAIVRYTLQSCLPPRRWAAVLLPCVGAVLFGLMSRALDDTAADNFANVAAEAIFSLTMPITALVVGDAVLGAEVRAGTFHFTWLAPVRLWRIVIGRWIGGAIVAAAAVGASCLLAALVAGAPSAAAPRWSPASPGRSPTWPCSSPSAASPSAPRCGRWRSCSSSNGCSARR
ncbi:MAG: ABC transporter permease subunit [Ilumatobacteraceae bacterium]